MLAPSRVLAVIITLLLLGGVTPFAGYTSPVLAQIDHESISPQLAAQLDETHQGKQALTPVERKIDQGIIKTIKEAKSRISKLPPGQTPSLKELSSALLRVDDAGIIDVKLKVNNLTAEQLERLQVLGMNIRINLPRYGLVEGSIPYHQAEAIAGLDFVRNLGPLGYGIHNTGAVTSAGDTVLRAWDARTAFGVDGTGVKIGVMSDGVDHLADSLVSGDLPSSPAVQVLQNVGGDEGTAMLEIIHDLAPGSSLAFYAPITSSDMVAGIRALETAGCNIIVDDLTFFDEPKFEDGPIAQEARDFYTGGGVYVSSAGNSGQRHYQASYNQIPTGGGSYSYIHDYGGGDIGNTFIVPAGGSVITILQWNNQWGSSGDDFDLFLARSSDGQVQASSGNRQDGNDDPAEMLVWTNTTGSDMTVYLAVLEYSLTSPPSSLVLDYNVYYGSGLQYLTPGDSIIGHAAVEEVLSTATANAATPGTIAPYSSRGPAMVYFPSQQSRQVPAITGVDGVQTKTGQLGYFSNPFYGTSAAAPHVAAIAALVWEADPSLTPAGVASTIKLTAVDLGSAGWDGTWGSGRADAHAAVDTLTLESPTVTTNIVTSVGGTTAILNGVINDDGDEACEYRFEYDTDSSEPYAYNTAWTGSKTSGQSFSEAISGLSPGTTYYFRAQAKNSAGTGSGTEQSFTTSPLSWYDSSWLYRKQITIDSTKVAGNLSDFPVLINLPSDADLANDAQDDGNDILFTAADSVTKLSHEVESFNGGSGQLIAWVKVPNLSSTTDTDIYLYYGNSGTGSQEDTYNVWDSDYKVVQHLQEIAKTGGGYNDHLDSTSNSNHGEAENGVIMDSIGAINGANDFDGTDDVITIPNDATLDITSAITLQACIRADSVDTSSDGFLFRRNVYGLDVADTGSGAYIKMVIDVGGGLISFQSDPGTIAVGSWYHIVATYDGTNWIIYRNGVQIEDGFLAGNIQTSTNDLVIGEEYNSSFNFNGIIDEVRISSTARSAEWILTEYYNQGSPATFYTVGSEQTQTGEIISFTVTDYGDNGVQFGSVYPGTTNQPADWDGSHGAVILTVGQETNVNVNIQLKGTDFSGPDTISVDNIKYASEDNPTIASNLTGTYATWYTVTQPLTNDNVTQVYKWISVPSAKPPGGYTSTFYYRAMKE
ncbi:DUF2341 domain-containing protein [Bacteroidota bacterium]